MVDAIVGPLIGKVHQLALSEADALVAVNKQIRELRHQLVWLQAFIRHAESKRRSAPNELIVAWVQQTRSVADEVEDAVDKYLLEVDLSRFPTCIQATKNLVAGVMTQINVRRDLCTRIDIINEKIKQIANYKEKYMIGETTLLTSTYGWNSSTSSTYTAWDNLENHLVGRDEELARLRNGLLNAKEKLQLIVFPIVGDNGVGKTKFARAVYDDPNIKKHFKICNWMNLIPYVGISENLHFISKRLVPKTKDTDKELVRDKIRKELNKNQFLIVLDGVVSLSDWNAILHILPDNNNGSRVIVITSFELFQAPSHHQIVQPIRLSALDKDKSKILFRQWVTPAGSEGSLTYDYEEDLYYVSGGLPIAIVVLSGLLRTKEYPHEWKEVFKHLKKNKISKRLKKILSLCFDDLPHQVKSCFLYLAALPENNMFSADKLVRLWMAEGFIMERRGKTIEEVGHEYLNELILRGLLQLDRKDANGGIYSVIVHDCLHAFAQSEAKEVNFMEIHERVDAVNTALVRRLSLKNYVDKYVPLNNLLPKLRTMLCEFKEQVDDSNSVGPTEEEGNNAWVQFLHGVDTCLGPLSRCLTCHFRGEQVSRAKNSQLHTLNFLSKSVFLRVLSLQGLKIVAELPDAIGNLIHLRYLGIKCPLLKRLPASIRKLTNLQTLDVMGTSVRELPEDFWMMISTLRHVLGKGLKLPTHVRDLQNLQTLDGVWVPSITNCPLDNMIHLRSLKIQLLAKDHTNNLHNALDKLEHLRTLFLQVETFPYGILAKSNLQRLQVLELEAKLISAENITEFLLPNLTELKLSKSEVPQDFIDQLSKLPLLTELTLEFSYTEETLEFCQGGFPSLSKVVLKELECLAEVIIEDPAMPNISSFVISKDSSDPIVIYCGSKIFQKIEALGMETTVEHGNGSEN